MKMIIGGKKVDSSDGKTIDIINPATHEVIDTVPAATREDVETVILNAQKGFEEWSAVPLSAPILRSEAIRRAGSAGSPRRTVSKSSAKSRP